MNHEQATQRAIAALRANGDTQAAQVLEDELLITGRCQYCEARLTTNFELVTLQDTCENCLNIGGTQPGMLKKKLVATVKQYDEYNPSE